MFQLDIRTDVAALLENLSDREKRKIPWATKKALDATAVQVVAAEREEMRRVFENPRDWTLNSVTFRPATYDNGSGRFAARPAIVDFKDAERPNSAGYYLRPQVFGGGRRHTPFESRLIRSGKLRASEYLVPTRFADRDAAGDLNPGQITKILSDLSTIDEARKYSGARNLGVRSLEGYHIDRSGRVRPGIYKRRGAAARVPVFIITRQPHYRAIFDFVGVAHRTMKAEFAANFRRELRIAVAASKNRKKILRSPR